MTAAQEFDENWKRLVAQRRAARSRYPAPKRPKNRYGYVYLMRHRSGYLKVGFTTRRSDFEVGRIAQHLSEGWAKVKVARFESSDLAKEVESDVLWLWSRHKIRRRLSPSAMPQSGGTEVAEDCDLAVRLFNRTVSIARNGGDARVELAPPGVKVSERPLTSAVRSQIVGTLVVGVTFKPAAVRLGAQSAHRRGGWLLREPHNPHDRFAVAVHCDVGEVGYIPAAVARAVAPQIPLDTRVPVVLSFEPGSPVKIKILRLESGG